MGKFCTSCGVALNEGAKICAKCGAKTAAYAKSIFSDAAPAYQSAGELALPSELISATEHLAGEGLVSLLKSGFRGLVDSFKRTLGDKKRLGIVIALAFVWLLVNLLVALGIYPLPIRALSWLTAAQGSLVSGTIGKTLVAATFAQIIADKGMLTALKSGSARLRDIISGNTKEKTPLFLGAGAALVICNMIAFTDMQNAMTGMAGFVLSVKALTGNGFLRRFATTILPKAENAFITAVMGGWASGFALFIIVSLFPGNLNGYLVGILLLIAGGIIRLTKKSKKGASIS